MDQQFLSRSEFSKALGISISTLNRGAKKNKWPFNAYTKIGHSIRYPADLIDAIKQKAAEGKGADNE
jgi:predicted DNA-binding transcriptional regulator AlpA